MLGQGNRTIYLSVIGGKFAHKTTVTDQSKVARINKKNETIYENHYAYVEGRLTEISFKEGTFGEELILIMQDGEENYTIQMPASSANAKSFLNSATAAI